MKVVDRRQFIIMGKPYEREDFKYITLDNGKILSYHEDLHIKFNKELGIYLLGWAFPVIGDEIVLDENCVQNRRYWAGRWLLIYKNIIYPDACGTLGCYYGENDDEGLCISSSLHLLNSILNNKEDYSYKVQYGDGNGIMDYYPIPYTPIQGIYKLLPSQFFDMAREEHIIANDHFINKCYKNLSRNEIRDALVNKLGNALKCIQKEFGDEIWLPLTAGVDSRTILVIAKNAGVKVSTYTIIRRNITDYDKNTPKKIAKKYKLSHIYLNDINIDNEDNVKLFDEHCSGFIVGTERQQFASGAEVPIKSKAMVLWGTVWEAYYKSYFVRFKGVEGIEDIEGRLECINDRCRGIVKKSSVHEKSLRAWLKNCEEHPIKDYEWRERMYTEQRVGSWVSGAMQAFDLFDSERIAPINCTDLLELLLSLKDVKPRDKSFQKELIEVYGPEVSNIPYGAPTDLFYRIKRKVKRYLG